MDKQFYEGIVKSFDIEKKKHVVLYEDGDVEVLRLDKERWEPVDNGKKSDKRSSSSKSFHPKGASSWKKNKSIGGINLEKKVEEKSPSSQGRGKRTPRKSPKQKQRTMLRIKSSMGAGGSPDVTHLEFIKPSTTESDPEQEQNEKSGKVLSAEEPSDKDKKQLEDGEKGSNDEDPEEENDSKDTQSDHVGGSPLDADESDNEAVSSSDMKQLDQIKEQSGQEDEETDTMDAPAPAIVEADKKSSTSVADTELSDDETLSTWKQRAGKKIRPGRYS